MTTDEMLSGLPGESIVRAGMVDLASGRRTAYALLVSIARTRLTRAGLLEPKQSAEFADAGVEDAELELYRLLRSQGGDAYSRYNALLRELVSFESALDARRRRAR